MEDYAVLINVCSDERIFWYSFAIDVLLTGIQKFKIMNCVTLRFMNT